METNILTKLRNIVKKSQMAGGRPVGYLQSVTELEDLNSGLPRSILNPEPTSDYNTSALNYAASYGVGKLRKSEALQNVSRFD